MNIDPRGLSPEMWMQQSVFPLSKIVIPPVLTLNWQEWARILIQLPPIAQLKPPDPLGFTDWREWAIRFNQAVPL